MLEISNYSQVVVGSHDIFIAHSEYGATLVHDLRTLSSTKEGAELFEAVVKGFEYFPKTMWDKEAIQGSMNLLCWWILPFARQNRVKHLAAALISQWVASSNSTLPECLLWQRCAKQLYESPLLIHRFMAQEISVGVNGNITQNGEEMFFNFVNSCCISHLNFDAIFKYSKAQPMNFHMRLKSNPWFRSPRFLVPYLKGLYAVSCKEGPPGETARSAALHLITSGFFNQVPLHPAVSRLLSVIYARLRLTAEPSRVRELQQIMFTTGCPPPFSLRTLWLAKDDEAATTLQTKLSNSVNRTNHLHSLEMCCLLVKQLPTNVVSWVRDIFKSSNFIASCNLIMAVHKTLRKCILCDEEALVDFRAQLLLHNNYICSEAGLTTAVTHTEAIIMGQDEFRRMYSSVTQVSWNRQALQQLLKCLADMNHSQHLQQEIAFLCRNNKMNEFVFQQGSSSGEKDWWLCF